MQIKETTLSGLIIIEPKLFKDNRGYFLETYQNLRYKEINVPNFVQDNISRSNKNTLRGLHYQLPHEQGKLVSVTRGIVWDVAVDIRKNSSTFGQWFGITLSDENHLQMYIPPGFAHGFCVISEVADFQYKCTDFYTPSAEQGIAWDDPTFNIEWPISKPVLSPKDKTYPYLKEIPHERLFA